MVQSSVEVLLSKEKIACGVVSIEVCIFKILIFGKSFDHC